MENRGQYLCEHGHVGYSNCGQKALLQVKKTQKVEAREEHLDVTVRKITDFRVLTKSQKGALSKDSECDGEGNEEGCDNETTSI